MAPLHHATLSGTTALVCAEGSETDPQEAAAWPEDAPAELDMQTPEERDMQLQAEAEAEAEETAREAGEAGLQTQAKAEAGEEGEGECCILAGTVKRRSAAAACSAFVTRLNRHLFSHIKACDAADLFFYMHGIPTSKKGCAMWAWLHIASARLMPVMLKKLRSM